MMWEDIKLKQTLQNKNWPLLKPNLDQLILSTKEISWLKLTQAELQECQLTMVNKELMMLTIHLSELIHLQTDKVASSERTYIFY